MSFACFLNPIVWAAMFLSMALGVGGAKFDSWRVASKQHTIDQLKVDNNALLGYVDRQQKQQDTIDMLRNKQVASVKELKAAQGKVQIKDVFLSSPDKKSSCAIPVLDAYSVCYLNSIAAGAETSAADSACDSARKRGVQDYATFSDSTDALVESAKNYTLLKAQLAALAKECQAR